MHDFFWGKVSDKWITDTDGIEIPDINGEGMDINIVTDDFDMTDKDLDELFSDLGLDDF